LTLAKVARGELVVQRARPRQAKEIATFINKITGGRRVLSRADVMAAFGEKAFLLLYQDEKLVGLVGWQVENLVARTDDIYIDPKVHFREAINAMMNEVERASRELQSEIALVFLPRELAPQQDVWRGLGFQERAIHSLKVRAWEEAASESKPAGSIMFFKQLRKDRVLRPV
jgi:dephospho-CoA kinase